MNFNELYFGGNLSQDVVLKQTQNGKVMCNFSIASNYKYKEHKEVCFLHCTAFGTTAETIHKYFSKGNPILVRGRLQMRDVEKDGVKKTYYSLLIDRFWFTDFKKQEIKAETPVSQDTLPRSDAMAEEGMTDNVPDDNYVPQDEDDRGVPF